MSNYAIPTYRVMLVREAEVRGVRPQIRSVTDLYGILKDQLAGADREHFMVVMLNRKNRLIGLNTVSIGSLTASVVHPREVYKPAILCNASAVAFGHNHPSGDPQPSQEDRHITARLVEAGKLLGIQVLDHLIIGEQGYFSFADHGILS